MDEEIVLRNSACDAGRIGLLKRVGADQRKRNLTCDENERNAVDIGCRKTGNRIRRAGAGSYEAYARLSRRTGVAVGHVNGALLMAAEHERKLSVRQTVENIKNRSPRITEENINTGLFERFYQSARAGTHFIFLHIQIIIL